MHFVYDEVLTNFLLRFSYEEFTVGGTYKKDGESKQQHLLYFCLLRYVEKLFLRVVSKISIK